jgi:membrane-bound serine protease (ClpP class)
MDPAILAALLFVLGVVLLFGELLLPTAGVLGILGGLAMLASIIISFTINQWVGLSVFVAVVILAPLIGSWVLNSWPRTGVGRRIVLQPVELTAEAVGLPIGQTGVAITELRPMGEVEFDDEQRMEAMSERGIIRPGQKVKVVGVSNGKPTVRAVKVETTEAREEREHA